MHEMLPGFIPSPPSFSSSLFSLSLSLSLSPSLICAKKENYSFFTLRARPDQNQKEQIWKVKEHHAAAEPQFMLHFSSLPPRILFNLYPSSAAPPGASGSIIVAQKKPAASKHKQNAVSSSEIDFFKKARLDASRQTEKAISFGLAELLKMDIN